MDQQSTQNSVPTPQPPRLTLLPVRLALVLTLGILLGVGGYAGYQQYIATTKPFVPYDIPSPALIPTNTTTYVPSTTPTVLQKKLPFIRPQNWTLWGNSTNSFSFAYDGSVYNDPTGPEHNLALNSITCCASIFIQTVPYDGGSKRALIMKNVSYTKTDDTQEISYRINDKPALFLYSVDGSGLCSAGAVFPKPNQAIVITSHLCSNRELEPLLSTFQFHL